MKLALWVCGFGTSSLMGCATLVNVHLKQAGRKEKGKAIKHFDI
jgi:hypothetical protein